MSDSKTRVIVVEDEPDLNATIVSFLNLSGFTADGVRCAAELDAWFLSHDCDLAVVDIGLPDRSGLSVVEALRGRGRFGIVIVSARGQLDDRLAGYSTGTDHYLVKPVDMRELVAVLRALHDRLPPRQEEWRLDSLGWRLTAPNGRAVRLTQSELMVLKSLMERPGSPVTRAALAEVLGFNASSFDPRRLEIMIRRLRKKIAEEAGVEAPIETAHGVGYAFVATIRTAGAPPS
ncbi:MAG: response regulator transcription factor [Rhodospirillaceae bacterium]